MVEILRGPGNVIVSLVLAIFLGIGAAPVEASEVPIALDLSGRLFLLASGIAAIYGYAFSARWRRSSEETTGEFVSYRSLVLSRILSATLLAVGSSWFAILCAFVATWIRHRAVISPVGEIVVFLFVGVLLIAAGFAGAMTLAGLLPPSRRWRRAIQWTLFLPGMIALVVFRLSGGNAPITRGTLVLTLGCALGLCALVCALFLVFVPNRMTMRPKSSA
jgi:hypothetical protein